MKLNRFGYTAKIYLLISHYLKGKANKGYCSACSRNTFFIKNGEYDRDNYECVRCGSLPRQRMLMLALTKFVPDWKSLKIHESSPGSASSFYISQDCKDYSSSQYYVDLPSGEYRDGFRCENIEKLTFEDNTFDVFITQEVMEHVFNPNIAIAEINRVLKPGGFHIFSTPYRNWTKTVQRAKLDEKGEVLNIEKPEYHGNPIGEGKSLVTFDWGNDFLEYIKSSAKVDAQIYLVEDEKLGLRGELLEVFVCRKIQ